MKNGILVLIEHLKGSIQEISFEMLGIGRRIANELKVPLFGIIIGKNVTQLSSNFGVVDSIIIIDNEKLEMPPPSITAYLLDKVMQLKEVSLVLMGGTNVSAGIGPILSHRLKIPFFNFSN